MHIRRHMKCSDSCSYCTRNPDGYKIFCSIAKGNTGHCYTFKEMCNLEPEKLPIGNVGMPFSVGFDLGRCEYCPAYMFFQRLRKPAI